MKLNDPRLFREQAHVDGRWLDADDGQCIDVFDPATGERLGRVPSLGEAETQSAIAAAEAAWPHWRSMLAHERAGLLRRWFELMVAATDDLACLMTAEQGKPLFESRGEIAYAASFIEWFGEEAKRVEGDIIATKAADRRLLTLRQPVGVCVAITPWNFPSAMITRKVAPALAAGCTVVVKPSGLTPFSALALAALAVEAGFPPGVFNVVTGDSSTIGGVFTASPAVRKLSFTGSTSVGRQLMEQCAPTLKRLSLELGGNAPFIVFDDADLEGAVKAALASKYRNSGQTCVCANRILVQSGIHDAFVERLASESARLKVGAGTEKDVRVGPLINEGAFDKVERLVADARDKGARVLTGGRRHGLGGTFFEPTVLADVTAHMKIANEEVFGPVAPVFRFETEEDAIAMANDTEYGLAAYVCARDVGRVTRVSEALEFGMVAVNTGGFSSEVFPFGGIKQSGFGREGGRHGIDEFLELKSVCIAGVDQ